MAAVSITAANVITGGGGSINRDKVFGETVTAGQSVYLKSSDDRWWLAQCDGTASEVAALGVALIGGAAGQPAFVQMGGLLTIGGTVVAGTPYYVGRTAGSIVPHSDLLATDKVTLLGYATTTGVLYVLPINTGVTVA